MDVFQKRDIELMKQKQSMAKRGSNNPMYGKRHDEVSRRKISDAQKTRWGNIKASMKEAKIITKKELEEISKNVALELTKLINSN